MRQFFITSILFFSIISAFAQHTIKGKVFDEKGNSLSGATVSIPNSSLKKTSDKNGFFNFDGLSNTNYKLKVSFIGFETTTLQVETDKELKINLKASSVAINEITVTSLRATDKSPIAFTNIDKEELAKSNLGQDIPYLLSQTPSLVVSSDAGTGIGYTNFRIRGTDASRINITINGIPYNDPDEQGAYWVDVPDLTSSVENIQIQRGVGTTTNGAAAFGANVNIQTNNYVPIASGEFAISYGSFNTLKSTMKASSGLLNGHWAVDTRLSTIKSDGYIDRGWVNMKSYFVQAGYYNENTSIKLITFGGTEKTYHAWNGVPKDSLATHRTYNSSGYMGNDAQGQPLYYKDQTDNYTQTHYQLILAHVFNSSLSINGALHYTRGDGYYEEYKQNQSFEKYSIPTYDLNGNTITKSDLVRQKIMGNNFTGAVFSLNYSTSKLTAQLGGAANSYWGDHWGEVSQVNEYPNSIFPLEYYRNNVLKSDANIYIKSNYELLKNVYLNAELQYREVHYAVNGKNDKWDFKINQMQELDINKTFNFINPKAGILFKMNDMNDLYGSFAVANREPTRTNYTDASVNNLPTNETLYDYEGGYKFHNKNITFGANLYFMNYHNQLILNGKLNKIGEPLSENVLSSYRTGVEFIGGIKLSENMRWDGSLTLSQNRITNFDEFVDVYDENWNPLPQQKNLLISTPIAYSPSISWNNSFTLKYGRFEAKLFEQYIGKQYIDNTGTEERSLDAYFISNVRFSYSLPVEHLRGIDFSLLVNNLNNAKYISNAWTYSYYQGEVNSRKRYSDFGYFPQARINFLVGITIKF